MRRDSGRGNTKVKEPFSGTEPPLKPVAGGAGAEATLEATPSPCAGLETHFRALSDPPALPFQLSLCLSLVKT